LVILITLARPDLDTFQLVGSGKADGKLFLYSLQRDS
jgi:hypothetical protein